MFKNKINGISLFSNVGIAETYLSELGINICVANELVEERARFYKHLYPDTNMIVGDITDASVFAKVIAEAQKCNVEFLIATPPCQGMSCAGRKDAHDPRNYLIYYAIEAIKQLLPKFVILENVPMQQHTKILYKNEEVFIPQYVQEELGEHYNFNQERIVNTKDFGIPQSRQRYVYLMTRKSENLAWEFPSKCDHVVTLREAIGNLPSLDPNIREENERWRFPDFEQKMKKGLEISKWHTPPLHSWKQVEWMLHTPSGLSAFKNEIFYPKKDGRRIKGAPRTYMRMDWDKPATTVMQNSGVISAFSTVHPGRQLSSGQTEEQRIYSDPRALSIYELLIVSSLPTDWRIPDWAKDVLIRKVIGEGIPPKLIKCAVEALIEGGHFAW